MNRSLPGFFNQLGDSYSDLIRKCVPRYEEMLWALLNYLPSDWMPGRILELGCGTGNLTALLAQRFPSSNIHVVDVAADLLSVCRQHLGDRTIDYTCCDFRELDLTAASYELVISSISLHHLDDAEKKLLFGRLHDSLCSNGWMAYADQFSAPRTEVYQQHLAAWRQQAACDDSEWEEWMSHQEEHDHHASLTDQFDWLRQAGFEQIDCVWRHLLWTVVQARKGRAAN